MSSLKISPLTKIGSAYKELSEAFKASNPAAVAVVLGPTGEVGREVVRNLLSLGAYSKVIVATRRELEYDGPNSDKLVQVKVDYDNIEKHKEDFKEASTCFCCLGTTRGKAGKEGFYKVDHDYVINSAKMLKENGLRHFSMCSAQGANPSSMFYYPKVKGQTDDELKQLGFERLTISRPAFLVCEREESRPMERFFGAIISGVNKLVPNLMSVSTADVARAMVSDSFEKVVQTPVVTIYENKDIVEHASRLD
ncbi:Oxidoreductase HTATIP2 [Zancudomyces culisetae]|uniref:Oxidoreductase HTATIP2 n=1 Tax=Zancudomyces culisetae TaxID=1213189 RepID=A0A1R1PQ69_ZANCU|nr:Oxidoreductase HTATIP2 [Zancudomyces culisetae]OMH84553.1 Oxidoreductase HTATIP2 [Zancudomyces culisetae]|eukprot:OMH83098.1 Oxidoreductase HTATIP2 [Zancudomyces culisetae]